MAGLSTCYISCGCNRTPHSADWGLNNLICFGSCRSVAIYNAEGASDEPSGITATYCKHKDRVNCVRWIRRKQQGPEIEFVSGSVDTTAVVWKQVDGQYKPVSTLSGHTAPVTALTAMYVGTESDQGSVDAARTVVVTASADSTVKIWSREAKGEFSNVQTVNFGSGFALDLAIIAIPGTDVPILACAGDDQRVHIFVEQGGQFVRVMTLSGHEDWVRALSFTEDDSGDLLLASAAQDYLIRIWRFSRRSVDSVQTAGSVSSLPLEQDIKMKENTFCFKHDEVPHDVTFAVSLESVLSGHENWIYSLEWQPRIWSGDKSHQPLCLLSASMDKTMILWMPDPDAGVWLEKVRVGAVGGNTLGLYGGMFSPEGESIMAHGYQGAFHHWRCNKLTGVWEPAVTASGHFQSVEDLAWDTGGGQFLLSISADQTCRLHAPWVKDGRKVSWYELARPQVHGYDLQCLAMINRYKFASGADEKVVRAFDAPLNFIKNFCQICAVDLNTETKKEEAADRPEGASVPALGLSNKAVFPGQSVNLSEDLEVKPSSNDQYGEVYFKAVSLQTPPSEEHLLQNSLWPETQKLYGHGYEVFALACDPDGKVLASSCKAAKAEHAGLILWDIATWRQLGGLDGPTLTVTQIAFSNNGQYLLCVSRDRTWHLYQKQTENAGDSKLFISLGGLDKRTSAHSRIIWSCAWSHDDRYFITGSRDKKVMLWLRPDLIEGSTSPTQPFSVQSVPDSATAVAMAPVQLSDNRYIVAVGLDSGVILLYTWTAEDTQTDGWQQVWEIDQNTAHHLTVKRLKFRPCLGLAGLEAQNLEKDSTWLQLASCSADHSVKIFNINLKKL